MPLNKGPIYRKIRIARDLNRILDEMRSVLSPETKTYLHAQVDVVLAKMEESLDHLGEGDP